MRTVSYPMFELSTIVDILGNSRKAGKTISKQLLANIASHSNSASIASGIFNQRLAAFKHFNLIEVEKNNITFTPLADLITSGDKSALKNAFLAPETFNKMYGTLEKNIELDNGILENIATLQIGITESGKKIFVKNFIESGLFCELIEHSTGTRKIIIRENTKSIKTTKEFAVEQKPQNLDIKGSQKAELNTSRGKAIIIVPEELTEEDKKKLKAQIELF